MQKSFLFLILTINSLLLFAQEEFHPTIAIEPTIRFGISTLAFGEREVFKRNPSSPIPATIETSNDFSFSIGAYTKFKLTPKTGLQIGSILSREHYSTVMKGALFGSDFDASLGGIISTSTIESDFRLWRLSIPFLYYTYLKESPYFLVGGLSGSFVLSIQSDSSILFGNGMITFGSSDDLAVVRRNILGVLGIGRTLYLGQSSSAFSISLKGNYFFFSSDIRLNRAKFNNAILTLELGYEF